MSGIYVLIISIKKASAIKIGALGKVYFRKGLYAYIGSAQNSLEKRIKRHTLKQKNKHWHIDYLTTKPFVEVIKVYIANLDKSFEQKIALILSNSFSYIEKFGCTDSLAKSHLFFIPEDILSDFIEEISKFGFEEFVFN